MRLEVQTLHFTRYNARNNPRLFSKFQRFHVAFFNYLFDVLCTCIKLDAVLDRKAFSLFLKQWKTWKNIVKKTTPQSCIMPRSLYSVDSSCVLFCYCIPRSYALITLGQCLKYSVWRLYYVSCTCSNLKDVLSLTSLNTFQCLLWWWQFPSSYKNISLPLYWLF